MGHETKSHVAFIHGLGDWQKGICVCRMVDSIAERGGCLANIKCEYQEVVVSVETRWTAEMEGTSRASYGRLAAVFSQEYETAVWPTVGCLVRRIASCSSPYGVLLLVWRAVFDDLYSKRTSSAPLMHNNKCGRLRYSVM